VAPYAVAHAAGVTIARSRADRTLQTRPGACGGR
jgi:hypothetical protein